MTRFLCLLPALLLLSACKTYTPSPIVSQVTDEKRPFTMTFVERQDGPSPLQRDYYFHLTLTNPREQPTWFVLQSAGNVPLRPDGMFHSKDNFKQPFTGWRHDGTQTTGRGAAVLIEHHGRDPFTAFLLPPQGRVEFARYHVTSPLNFHKFEIWEASSIWVGTTELQDWLPYAVTSDADVYLDEDAYKAENLDWDAKRLGSREDYPKEPVKMIYVETKRRWVVDLKY